jgi:hypothetical protein
MVGIMRHENPSLSRTGLRDLARHRLPPSSGERGLSALHRPCPGVAASQPCPLSHHSSRSQIRSPYTSDMFVCLSPLSQNKAPNVQSVAGSNGHVGTCPDTFSDTYPCPCQKNGHVWTQKDTFSVQSFEDEACLDTICWVGTRLSADPFSSIMRGGYITVKLAASAH